MTTSTQSLAWGDVDGDGDLDLAVGNDCTISSQFRCYGNQLFRNSAGTLVADPIWSPEPVRSTSLAWGDVDGDGDLDLAVSNRDRPNQLYRNDKGALPATPERFAPIASGTRSLAWGDVDGDGDLDLVVANTGNLNDNVVTIYNNGRNVPQRKGATPSVRVLRPAPPADGGFGSAPRIFDQPTLTFTYTLRHPSAWPVQRVIGQYSLDGGAAGARRSRQAPS